MGETAMSAAQSRFEGKVVAITGGGMGIGRTYGRRFAAEGASIVVADLDPEVGEREGKELEALGTRAVSVAMDVSDEAGAAAMVEAATSAFGGVDILVNNAGIHLEHAQLPFTVEALPKWRRVLDVNVIGALNCSAACRPSMKERG